MPTGYTAPIQDGISFKEFVMSCARAFGALILMRDGPSDAPIPVFKPDSHHKNELERAGKKLGRLNKMTVGKAFKMAKRKARINFLDEKEYYRERIKESKDLRKKYQDMLAQVRTWQPPTKNHCGLKRFMIQQIKSSINFDCIDDYYEGKDLLNSEPLPPGSFLAAMLQKLSEDIRYHSKEWRKEVKRSKERNEWVGALLKSLGFSRKSYAESLKKRSAILKRRHAKTVKKTKSPKKKFGLPKKKAVKKPSKKIKSRKRGRPKTSPD